MTISQARKAVIAIAVSNIGYRETGENITKFAAGTWDNKFYGWELQGQAWCDVFADYCYCQAFGNEKGAAMTYQRLGSGSALCRTSAQYYKNNNAFFDYPEPGDQVFFQYNGPNIGHTGIVETVTGTGTNWSRITTIEGNTSNMVARRTYYKGNATLAGFGRPKWSLVTDGNEDTSYTPQDPVNIPETQWPTVRLGMKNAYVKKLQEYLIKLGYDCGKTGADGEFGNNTLKAVLKFQRDYQLEVDGIVGPMTWSAIEKAIKEAGSGTPAPTTPTQPTQPTTPTEPATPVTFNKGDKIKIKEGAVYYNTKVAVPSFVLSHTWIIYSISGDRAVINENVEGTNKIMSPINTQYLIKA